MSGTDAMPDSTRLNSPSRAPFPSILIQRWTIISICVRARIFGEARLCVTTTIAGMEIWMHS